jgi:alginate O-acetyltransferase complex protein AlgI
MGFVSFEFVLLLFPAALILYFIARHVGRHSLAKGILAGASLIFYYSYGLVPLLILLADIAVNWFLSRMLERSDRKRMLIGAGIFGNVLMLMIYRYADFFVRNGARLAGMDFTPLDIIQPAAISYYTFRQIAWLIDSYRGETRGTDSLDYLVFILFFPSLIMGPVTLHTDFIPQLNEDRRYRPDAKNLRILGTLRKFSFCICFQLKASVRMFSTSRNLPSPCCIRIGSPTAIELAERIVNGSLNL